MAELGHSWEMFDHSLDSGLKHWYCAKCKTYKVQKHGEKEPDKYGKIGEFKSEHGIINWYEFSCEEIIIFNLMDQ